MTPAWLLPEYVEDILPHYARAAERLRRRLLDLFDAHGYDLVSPPLVEYLESLLTGAARDLDLKTFKVVDGLSGRMLGVRADMTPQAARVDAHLINHQGPTRLCYAGPVLRTKPSGKGSREPFQVGAELFGHAGIEADLEIQGLLLAALQVAGVPGLRLSLGHAGLFRALAGGRRPAPTRRPPCSPPCATRTCRKWKPSRRPRPALAGRLPRPAQSVRRPGGPGQGPRRPAGPARHRQALDDLERLLAAGRGADLAVDLADLRGDGYHNGVMFAAYAGGQSRAVALGGRYDGAGAVFGRSRAATGFSLDLRQILDCLPDPEPRPGILAPRSDDAALAAAVAALRQAGERVVMELPGHESRRAELGCDRILVRRGQDWVAQGL
jgi:ATP phosphoribosyltransferase regulatory subunit